MRHGLNNAKPDVDGRICAETCQVWLGGEIEGRSSRGALSDKGQTSWTGGRRFIPLMRVTSTLVFCFLFILQEGKTDVYGKKILKIKSLSKI